MNTAAVIHQVFCPRVLATQFSRLSPPHTIRRERSPIHPFWKAWKQSWNTFTVCVCCKCTPITRIQINTHRCKLTNGAAGANTPTQRRMDSKSKQTNCPFKNQQLQRKGASSIFLFLFLCFLSYCLVNLNYSFGKKNVKEIKTNLFHGNNLLSQSTEEEMGPHVKSCSSSIARKSK